jgi:rhamnosyl/mannosyltransferase
MHVLQIYKDVPPVLGGIEHHLRDLCMGLAARGHTLTVLVTSLDGRTYVERPLPNLTILRAGRALHVASTPLSPAMLALARVVRPDVVHLHFPYPPGDLAALLVPNRPPLVVTYHSDIVRQRLTRLLYRPLMAHTLRRAARIIATSPDYIRSSAVLRAIEQKCVVVPLGVDARRFAPGFHTATGHTDEPTFKRHEFHEVAPIRDNSWPYLSNLRFGEQDGSVTLFVGRLRYYKGLHVLIAALPHIPGVFWIAGTGPERERLESQAAALGVAARVRFLGDVPDESLPALYRAADVFVLPAHLRAEAFGIAQLEAMASGLPCVSTALGTGTSFANQHGETGLVVPPNDPHALAAALNTLLADPTLRQRYGEAARQRVLQHFTTDRMVDGIEAVYQSVTR